MIINPGTLRTLYITFNAAFQGGVGVASSLWPRIATRVPSTTRGEEYGWIGQIPSVREWVGDRVVQNITSSGYTIRNRPFELTVSVDRDDIEDDNLGIYSPLFAELGRSTGSHYDQLVWGLLKAGFSTPCYDGQYFFDTDHPVIDADGVTINSVANTDGGSGAPWFLIDDSRALKPLILQVRKDWQLVRKDQPTDDNVFDARKFVYGVDARHAVGFGFWQFAWGSKQPLDDDHYSAARAALSGMKGDHGRPIGVMPKLLIVGASNEKAARQLVIATNKANGATNEWAGSAELLVVPWLA